MCLKVGPCQKSKSNCSEVKCLFNSKNKAMSLKFEKSKRREE